MTIQHVYLSDSVDFDPEVMTKIKSIARGTALSALGYGAANSRRSSGGGTSSDSSHGARGGVAP